MYAPMPRPSQYTHHGDYISAFRRWERERTMTPSQMLSACSDGELCKMLLTQDGKGPHLKRLALQEVLKRHGERQQGFIVERITT